MATETHDPANDNVEATKNVHSTRFTLEPDDAQRLANLCGNLDSHIRQIADHFQLTIYNRGAQFKLEGSPKASKRAAHLIQRLYKETHNGTDITPDLIHLFLQEDAAEAAYAQVKKGQQSGVIKTPQALIKPRGPHQLEYLERVRQYDINFGIGPAGTGKTFLAVAAAVESLMRDEVKRILLVRPAVEAGEKLGFLPGDLAQKIDPYLRPLYDALYEMLGFEQVSKLMERNVIEVAPLAYMRGRTLSHSFVILDESQNTTKEQMKMFLTRVGFGSKAVITGDVTQVDLPRGVYSGLKHGLSVLDGVDGIGVTRFNNQDVVRHPLVQKIVDAYDKHDELEKQEERERRQQRRNEQADD
ncbi:PhoH family protein [Bacterioplanoides sp. SCSIO 12839]|uniref:PhoH family protein n=1 Tax=Bacterioplanoides sp. SCSIO 12839 TaxID=2829569 RepID=UPI002104A31F|nr:PhoH family protein [Bacterioplanoides sp. SCSIO 12839]UTW49214.1 PhoH family protein [Bacterioplanoides sp. SCSIO 12839]